MANLYQIDQKLIDAIEYGCDTETGEFIDENGLNELYMELNSKIEGIALYQKNLESDIEAIDKEIKALQERRKSKQNRANSMKSYLSNYLLSREILNFETPKVQVKFNKSSSVNILDQNKLTEDFIRETIKREPDKKAIKEWYKTHEGQILDGAIIVTNQNISIK